MKLREEGAARNQRAFRGTAGRDVEPGIGKHSIIGYYMRENKLLGA